MSKLKIGTDANGEPIYEPEAVAPPWLDLSHLCRSSAKTVITIETDFRMSSWITAGEISLRARDSYHFKGICQLDARMNATDYEHDSLYALRIELVGVELNDISYGLTSVIGWIRADNLDSFRVPVPGYNPLKHKQATKCKQCKGKESHLVIPDSYVPPPNPELYNIVRGRKVLITTGAAKAH